MPEETLRELSVDSGEHWNISGEHWNIAQRAKTTHENNIESVGTADKTVRSPKTPRCDHGRTDMSATGLDVFDKTLQTTNIWLDEIMAKLGPDRQVAWHVLGAVLHALRDRLQIGLAVHLGAQLPLLVRGLYYDQWHPSEQTLKQRSAEQFLDHVSQRLADIRPVNVKDATHVTLQVLNHHLDPHQVEKVRQALPENIRALWPTGAEGKRFEPAA
jgi:uncharacterized protein (DUF2267 family)